MNRGMLDLLCEEKTPCTVRSYWSEQFILGNKTKKSPDEPPTDQEHRRGDQADQSPRVQLTARSISFDCLIFEGAYMSIFIFCLLSLRKASFQSSIVFLQQQSAVGAVDNIVCSNDVRGV